MNTAARYTHIVSCRLFSLVDVWFVLFQILNLPFVCFVQTLEELTDSYRTHSTDLAKTVSQYSCTQEEVRQIRCVCVCMSTRMYVYVWGFVSGLSVNSHVLQLISYHRTTVSELKEEVRRLILREREPTPLLSAHTLGKSLSLLQFSHTHTQPDRAI